MQAEHHTTEDENPREPSSFPATLTGSVETDRYVHTVLSLDFWGHQSLPVICLGTRQTGMRTDTIWIIPRAKESHEPPVRAKAKRRHSQTHLPWGHASLWCPLFLPNPGPHLALKQGGHGLLSDELRGNFMPGKLVALQPTHCTRLPSTS